MTRHRAFGPSLPSFVLEIYVASFRRRELPKMTRDLYHFYIFNASMLHIFSTVIAGPIRSSDKEVEYYYTHTDIVNIGTSFFYEKDSSCEKFSSPHYYYYYVIGLT